MATLLGAGAALGLAFSASATTFDYADAVTSFAKGGVGTAGGFNNDSNPLATQNDPNRSDPTDALGAPDGDFVSLGNGGTLVLEFIPKVFPAGVPTAQVVEVTFSPIDKHVEFADVFFAGADNVFSLAGTAVNTNPGGVSTFTIVSSIPVQFVKLVDTTLANDPTSTSFDGFDVDAVGIVVPLPASAWAGLGLLGVLGVTRMVRRRQLA